MKSNVRSYQTKELLDKMKSLPSFKGMPQGHHVIVVRSNENQPDAFDDKLYLFKAETFIDVMPCTSNSGTYGLKNFIKFNNKGTAVIKFDEIYYDAFMKSDNKAIKHHNGKMQCLRQIAPLKYYRDNDGDDKAEEIGNVVEGIYGTNVHANSYTTKKGIISWLVGQWSVGCTVINDLTKYYDVLLANVQLGEKVTYTGLKEF
jgi:hypothetical protein